ncbi:MAG: CopD family protein [Anaerolineae bacterium]|nr:CopD family protein [Anaerolineae bacterium]
MTVKQRCQIGGIALLLLSLIVFVRPALAHGYLIRAIPEDRAVLERPPARLQYWFSEILEPEFSSITVRDREGTTIAQGGISPENGALLTVRLPPGLPDGAYIVDMRIAFASDGHVTAQSSVFFVGTEVAGVEGTAANNLPEPLEILWRALSLSGIMLLFGTLTLYSGILIPAWGNRSYRAGLLPPRVMRRLYIILAGALIVAVIGSIVALLQQSMAFFNTDLSRVIEQNLWSVTRTSTRFGEVWNARTVLLGIVALMAGLSFYFRESQPETVRPFLSAAVWGMTLVIGTFSISSHAAGSLLWPWAAVFNDWLHALAVGFWAGGIGALVLLLPPALQPYQGEARRQALLAVMRRFSRWAVTCLILVISSGLYSASNWVYQPADMTQTAFGGALGIKLLLVAGLVAVGAAHHIALRPERYQRFAVISQRVAGFLPSLRLEALLIVVTLTSVGILSATPVPVPDFAEKTVATPTATQQVDDISVTLTLTPGGPGVNTYDIYVLQEGIPNDELDVRVQMVNPGRDWRGNWETAENASQGLYVTAGAEIDRVGMWWSLVDVTRADGTTQRVAFEWQIADEAAVLQSRPPSPVNVLALLGVIAALGWALYPSARRLYQKLDLSPAAVTVAVGAVIATIFFSILGFALVENQRLQYEAAINPAPTVVNVVLPDAQSIERGAALFTQHCIGWAGQPLRAMLERLPRTRDDAVYTVVAEGNTTLPACNLTLDAAQRWDIVNYLRTLQA